MSDKNRRKSAVEVLKGEDFEITSTAINFFNMMNPPDPDEERLRKQRERIAEQEERQKRAEEAGEESEEVEEEEEIPPEGLLPATD